MCMYLVPYAIVVDVCYVSMQERQQQEEELKVKEAELIRGNPLLNNPTSFSVKRRFAVLSPCVPSIVPFYNVCIYIWWL